MKKSSLLLILWISFITLSCHQIGVNEKEEVSNDVTTPLHLLQPDYPVTYGETTIEDIKQVIGKVADYLETVTPAKIIDKTNGEEITDFNKENSNATFEKGDFRMVSYEWGVTYAGMINAFDATFDEKYKTYVNKRLELLCDAYPGYKSQYEINNEIVTPIQSVIHPQALDDAGAMCAAMIKSKRKGFNDGLDPMIENYINFISNKQFRLDDGTLARNRPLPNTLWLDDLFMSVPALAQMGKLTGEQKYFDDAVRQVIQFSDRMFVPEKNLYMHGWVEGMEPHPAFHWARANGWAFMAMTELMDVLPEDHPGYEKILNQYRLQAKGLASYQDGTGFWHQLISRNDTYLETSATAIYTYCFAKGINRGWLDKQAYGPAALLAWNALSTKVNEKGQVEGTCVGTGMAFDPAFYYHRPVNIYAAHGYGPTLLAGSEMIKLLNKYPYNVNDSAVMF